MRRRVTAALAAVAVAGLAGCGAAESAADEIEARIVDLSPVVAEASVDLQRDAFADEIVIDMSVPGGAEDDLLHAVDAAYRAAWAAIDFDPTRVSVWVTAGDLPGDRDDRRVSDFVDLTALGDAGLGECDQRSCAVAAPYLEKRFGPRGES